MTDRQKEILQHMLGADDRYKKKHWGFRNHFCTNDGDEDFKELKKMEEKGLVKSGYRMGYDVFWATKAGAIAIGFKPYQLQKTELATCK